MTSKGTQIGCVLVTHLRLTNSTFCVLWGRMNHLEAYLMVSLRKKDSVWQFNQNILMRKMQNSKRYVKNVCLFVCLFVFPFGMNSDELV